MLEAQRRVNPTRKWMRSRLTQRGATHDRRARLRFAPRCHRRACVGSLVPFAHFLSWSDCAWNVACGRDDFCKVVGCCIFLEYPIFGRTVASAGLGKPEIISRRASGIILLWRKSSRSGVAVAVISASGYIVFTCHTVKKWSGSSMCPSHSVKQMQEVQPGILPALLLALSEQKQKQSAM